MSDTANNVEAFEAFHLEKVGVEAGPWENGRFVFDRVHERWEFWLSSRRQALEEAAAICEGQVCSASMFASAREAEDRRNTLAWAASAIRREAEGK